MSRGLAPFLFVLTVIVLTNSCRRDETGPSTGGSLPWYEHIEFGVDTACIQAPNVMTPNGDGINDAFRVVTKNIASIQIVVNNAAGDRVFTSSDAYEGWNGGAVGAYRLEVYATTTSGVIFQGASALHVMDYGNGSCLPFNGAPVGGDQFDPRHCGVAYPTNELFCP